jgi:hypothetical protein
MYYKHLTIKTLTHNIYNIHGVLLPSGTSFIISKKPTKIVDPQMETCLIYLDNGSNNFEDFNQHIVNKKLLYDNSI